MKLKYLTGGGIIAAILASSCCILPFIAGFIGIGIGGLGFFSLMETYRIPLIIISLALLSYAFYKVYFVHTKCEPDGTCKVNPKIQRANKILLWSFTIIAIFSILFPKIIGWF